MSEIKSGLLDIAQVFNTRTCYNFDGKDVDDDLLHKIYDIMKLGATSANSCPLRIVFVKSKEARETLYQCLAEGNLEHTKTASVTAIFAYDSKFYEFLPTLFPHNPGIKEYFSKEGISQNIAVENANLQAAYFMIVAKAYGLGCGAMGGFDKQAINKHFFADGRYQSIFLCNIGYSSGEALEPRLPRLPFDDICRFV